MKVLPLVLLTFTTYLPVNVFAKASTTDNLNVRCGHLAYLISKSIPKWTGTAKKHLSKTQHLSEQEYYMQIGFVNGYVQSQQVWTKRNEANAQVLIAAENYAGMGCDKLVK
jgi:hypothetical protein